jgi:hypothetical protein
VKRFGTAPLNQLPRRCRAAATVLFPEDPSPSFSRLEGLGLRGRDVFELVVAQPSVFFTRTGKSLAVRGSHRSLLRFK